MLPPSIQVGRRHSKTISHHLYVFTMTDHITIVPSLLTSHWPTWLSRTPTLRNISRQMLLLLLSVWSSSSSSSYQSSGCRCCNCICKADCKPGDQIPASWSSSFQGWTISHCQYRHHHHHHHLCHDHRHYRVNHCRFGIILTVLTAR